MLAPLSLALALLQPPATFTSPPGGDTAGYWQQRASYRIVATLDEPRGVLQASGTLTYVNHSPDTLREFYVHQYLNAFRPGSAWSAADEREGRVRFQRLADPEHAYERFTATPTFDGTPVTAEYPGAPDSTVARFALPRPLPPGDTLRVTFAWEARLSTLPRRQGRRGRSFDFAQWYPKVAVYDRGGWQPYALRPAGEFYGEFGDFDVTLVLRGDQVLGTTGVVVEGDPGWGRVLRWGEVAHAEPIGPLAADGVDGDGVTAVPDGYRRLRVVARDVHHFGWSVSPDYRYEGSYYLRTDSVGPMRFAVPDSVAVHVLYRPGDEQSWGRGQVVARTNVALRWFESIYGPYPYPQMTVLHRIEGGGTEFPMLQMNGSPSQGLILHEGGHIYSYGILANNEWRSGWMDEGLTSYQTSWAQLLTPQDRPRRVAPPPPAPPAGYAGLALRPRPDLLALTAQARQDLLGRTDPIGTPAHEFRDFGVYNAMIYGRAEHMYGALRDAIGDEAFRRFLRTYYERWALRHVDEAAMRAAAEAAAGRPLDWFFDQWVHRTGVVDYALDDVRVREEGGAWVTTGRVVRQGDYRHPMPLGVRVDTGWVLVRGDALADAQTITVRTASPPREVRLDPLRTTPDWYTPNDHDVALLRLQPAAARVAVDWPLLDQSLADRYVTLLAPLAWYADPGGVTVAGRARTSYLGTFDRHEAGIALASRLRTAGLPAAGAARRAPRESSRLQGWLTQENPKPWGAGRPLMGVRFGVWRLDGVTKVELGRTWDASPLPSSGDRAAHALTLTGTYPYERGVIDGRRWSGHSATDATWSYARSRPGAPGTGWRLSLTGGAAAGAGDRAVRGYATGEASWSVSRRSPARRLSHQARLFAGFAADAPPERGLYLSAASPTAPFASHFWRPEGGVLSAADVPYRPLGGAGLRGYDPLVPARAAAVANLEESYRLARFGPSGRPLDLDLTLFGDVGGRAISDGPTELHLVADAGLGLALRGALLDRDVRLRVDLPFYVRDPELAIGTRGRAGAASDRPGRLRLAFSFADLW